MTKLNRGWAAPCLLAAVALSAAAQEAGLLRLSLVEGRVDTYDVVTTMAETLNLPNGQGKVELDGRLVTVYKVKIGKVDEGAKAASVETERKIAEISSVGRLATMYRQKAVGQTETVEGIVTDRGVFRRHVPEGKKDPLSVSIGDQEVFIELPEKGVKVGDSWEMTLPVSEVGVDTDLKTDFKGTSKLVEERVVGGKPVWVISSSGTLGIQADATSLVKDAPGFPKGEKVLFKGTFQFKWDGLFEKGSGRALKVTSKSKGNVKLSGPSVGIFYDMSVSSTTVVTLR